MAKHKSLNFRCMGQAYVERISFITYLRKRFGLAPLVAIAYADEPLDVAYVERVLGARLDALALDHDKVVASAKGKAGSFRDKPIKYVPVCPVTSVE